MCQTACGKCHRPGYGTTRVFQNNSFCCLQENVVFNLCTCKTLNFLRNKYYFLFCMLKTHLWSLRSQVMLLPLSFSIKQFNTFLLCKAYSKWIIITELVLKFSPGFAAEFTAYLFYGLGSFLSTFVSLGNLRVYFF